MATPSHAQAVKSLNKSSGRQRFVFKTFSQRIEDIDIDVYRSLDKVKSEPSEGSSFFRDCLAEWRELNTAEDFISFYEEMLPLVQTLPLVIVHKETIMLELLSRLQIKARLSLEPILRLIAALSRDLLEEFLPFLPNFAESLVSLLESGADREPEIIEQIFTSWSHVMMYLQKYLTDKLAYILKVTLKLRYYPKDYVQDFMAEAVSFLFRNAPIDQLKQGVWKIMLEVVKKPLATRKYGVSFLLCYAMRGTSSRLHSKVERVLLLLMSDPVLNIGDKFSQGKLFSKLEFLSTYSPIVHIFFCYSLSTFYLVLLTLLALLICYATDITALLKYVHFVIGIHAFVAVVASLFGVMTKFLDKLKCITKVEKIKKQYFEGLLVLPCLANEPRLPKITQTIPDLSQFPNPPFNIPCLL
ncbi:hypothetical protein L484_011084 [Morus notabilis]|uniref:U3 small nucleolar RNA-associated protein 20 N-terminal domain-containing protein n=1 Tax=Morus notabilis TaxID=981085 RepID=W9S267_9ROSA|nr:hypothetical protein L484_011084 [Morus notabilis]